MRWANWVVVVVAVIEAGWMAYDGTRALVKGDYVTPKTGQFAGQLGPWSKLVSKVGLEPRSTLMKSIFSAYGFLWLIVIVCFALRLPWAWSAMLLAALGALWYLPFGTLLSLLQVLLLMAARVR